VTFVRVGDTFAYDPRTLHPLEFPDGDFRHVDECAGFSVRLAAESGGKEHEDTDRRVTRAMVLQLAGSPERANWLMERLVAAKVWEPDGTGYRLVNDTNYIHLLTQDEVENSRARGRDERNPLLTVPAKLRDGDNCRYCNISVNWGDRKSPRGATWDHVDISVQPTPVDLFVVCCKKCQEPTKRPPLKPPPAKPVYGATTKEFIRKQLGKWPTPAQVEQMYPGLRTWPLEIAAKGQRPASEAENAAPGQRTNDQENAAHPPPERPPAGRSGGSVQIPAITNLDSPGRVGSGSSGSGRAGPGSGVSSSAGSRKRSRRGRSTQPKENS